MDTLLVWLGLICGLTLLSMGTIPQAYLLLMSLRRNCAAEKLIIWQGINYYTTHNLTNNSTH